MAYKKWSLIALTLVVSAFAISFWVVTFGRADAVQTDWFTNAPAFYRGADYSTTPSLSNTDCEQTNVVVNRGTSRPYEQYCMVPTIMGLMDKQGKAVQPEGYTTANSISYPAPGKPVLIPVRNQASALSLTGYPSGPGATLDLFKQLSSHMKLKIDSTGIYYAIDGSDQIPDVTYKYPSGEVLRFNYQTAAYADNGRTMVIDTIWSGFVKVNFMDLSVKPFADSIPLTDGGGLLPAYTALDNDGRFAAIAYNAPGNYGSQYFKIVDTSTCQTAVPINSTARQSFGTCKSVDVLPKLKQVLPTLLQVAQVRFANDHTVTFIAQYRDATGSVKSVSYSMVADGKPKSTKQYLALGDSYISGEGALSYRDGTDTDRNQCHQSLVSYPYLLSVKYTSFSSLACSGARMFNVAPGKDANSPNQLKGSNPTVEENETAKLLELPGVLPQKSFVDSDNPEAITISITGNDIGFGQVLEKCVHPFKHLKDVVESESTCYDNYEDRAELVNTINAQFAKLRSLYESLRQNGMEGRRVYAVGYPQVAKVGGDCGLNVQMNADEVKFAHDLIEYLDSVIKRAADEAGVQYVDTQSAFDGHRLCEGLPGQMAVNGFTITKTADGGRNFKASFHPNQLGHQLLAQTIAGQTSNLSKPMPAAQPRTNEIILDNNIPLLQNVPKSNRPLRYVRVVHDLDGNVMSRMSPYKMVIESSDFFTKPNTVYNMVINSTPRNMGNFTSDANGNLSAETAIPADLPLGFHTVHLYGNDIFGNAIDIQKTIFVTAGTDDSDTDGIVDASDSCVYAAQSGIDADKDGVDDVCDPQIDAPPPAGGGTEPEGIVWSDKAIAPMEIQATAGP